MVFSSTAIELHDRGLRICDSGLTLQFGSRESQAEWELELSHFEREMSQQTHSHTEG